MLTKQLSDFLYEVRYESLPSKAVDNAKLYLEDLLGVAAAGSVQPQGGIWRSYFAAGDGQQEATAWNSGLERLSCEHAAALNAACAHVMDMDDVHNASITHLGAVTIPAAPVSNSAGNLHPPVTYNLWQAVRRFGNPPKASNKTVTGNKSI